MKTIEERAYKYAEVTTWDDTDGYPSDIYATNAYNAYVEGAKEQKAIDDEELLKLKSAWEKEAQINHDAEMHYKQGYHDAIEKACQWITEHIDIPYEGEFIDDSPVASDYIEWCEKRLECAKEIVDAFKQAIEKQI